VQALLKTYSAHFGAPPPPDAQSCGHRQHSMLAFEKAKQTRSWNLKLCLGRWL